MNKLIVRTGLFGILAAASLGLGGCGNNLKEENAALRETNSKLEADKTAAETKALNEQAARSDAESKAMAAQAEAARLQQQLAAQPPAAPTNPYNPPVGGGGGKERSTRGGSTRTILAGDVLFGPGSASLTSGGKKEIDKVIADIKSKHQGDTVRVEGYTDSDPIKKSSFGSNKALSQARAEAVEKYMASKGISASRITAVGMGSENPKSSKSASRRVEIVIVDTN